MRYSILGERGGVQLLVEAELGEDEDAAEGGFVEYLEVDAEDEVEFAVALAFCELKEDLIDLLALGLLEVDLEVGLGEGAVEVAVGIAELADKEFCGLPQEGVQLLAIKELFVFEEMAVPGVGHEVLEEVVALLD